jgi:hypothetical protein
VCGGFCIDEEVLQGHGGFRGIQRRARTLQCCVKFDRDCRGQQLWKIVAQDVGGETGVGYSGENCWLHFYEDYRGQQLRGKLLATFLRGLSWAAVEGKIAVQAS